MSSFFPSSIDNFANPVYTKIDGQDVVQAAHVNDLQDAVRAIQELLIAGKPINYNSNNYLADNTSFKLSLETLDDHLGALQTAFEQHKNAALVSDPPEHHGNVIAIDPIGNLSSDRVQPAIYELQSDIDNLLGVGTMAPAATLDYRYVNTSGADSMQGPLTITESLTTGKSTTFGTLVTDVHNWIGNFNLEGELDFDGDITTSGDLFMEAGKKIAELSGSSASYMLFETDRIEFASHKDFIFKLDADDASDAAAEAGKFEIRDGLDQAIMSLDEAGNLQVLSQVTSEVIEATTLVQIGDDTTLTDSKFDLKSDTLHIQLDKANTSGVARLLVTMDGDTGSSLASPDVLLNLDQSAKLTTGVHVLKSGVQETGYFGVKTYSPNAGGVFFGQGVNFKHELTNSPSSVVLTVGENVNAQNISITHVDKYGFFVEFDSVAVGAVKVRGTYTTVGN